MYEKKVKEFLAAHLPPREERIPTPMHPDCQVCVVIPTCSQSKYLLRTLHSLALQKRITPEGFEVIVVVYNPGHTSYPPSPLSRPGNQDTLEYTPQEAAGGQEILNLVHYIQNEKESPGIPLSPGEESQVRNLRGQGLRVYAIDKVSPGKTFPPADAHIGEARHRGYCEALERFYKNNRKNGIIAHTNPGTGQEEYYLHHLVKAFKENEELVGVCGPGEYTLENPRDLGAMKIHLWKQARHIYHQLLNAFFNVEKIEFFISPFRGDNMASLAFETVMVGGIPRKPHHENHRLARELLKIGKTETKEELVSFPLLPASNPDPPTKNHQAAGIEATGQMKVRSLEAAYFLAAIYRQLKQARAIPGTTPGMLGKILSIGNQPLLEPDDLDSLNRNLPRLILCRPEYLEKELDRLLTRITTRVDTYLKPVSPDQIIEIVLAQAFQFNNKIEKNFKELHPQVINERKEALKTFQETLEIFFAPHPQKPGIQNMAAYLTSLLEKNNSPLIHREFIARPYRIQRLTGLIALAPTPEQALEMIKINYLPLLFVPGLFPGKAPDHLDQVFFDLQVLVLAIRDSGIRL